MKGNTKIIKRLNEVLTNEPTAIKQHSPHPKMFEHRDSSASTRSEPHAARPPNMPATDGSRPAPSAGRVIDSAKLLAGARQLAIRHRETVYFLRETRLGKLILTK